MTKADACANGVVEEIAGCVKRLIRHVAESNGADGLGTIEQELGEARDAIGVALLRGVAAALGNGREANRLPCSCGGHLVYVGDRNKDVLTLLGWLKLRRAYYRCPKCKASRFPLDEKLGTVGQGQSSGVQLAIALVCALLPNGQAMRLLNDLKLPYVSVKESQRITREVGSEAVALRDEAAAQWSEEHTPPAGNVRRQAPQRLAVLMDGTTAHTDGDWHEVKVGTFYTFDAEGEATGQAGCVSTFEGIEHFRSLWDTEAQRWRMAEAPLVVALCDGAPWTWNTIAEYCPSHTIEVLDFYHAAEHLWELARAIWGESSPRGREWVGEQKARLLEGQLDAFFAELRRWASNDKYADAVGKQLRYFEANRARLRYAEAQALGCPIGSGMVEAACKTIVCIREKQPGMRWRKTNAEIIAHLRCLYYGGRWECLAHHMRARARPAA